MARTRDPIAAATLSTIKLSALLNLRVASIADVTADESAAADAG